MSTAFHVARLAARPAAQFSAIFLVLLVCSCVRQPDEVLLQPESQEAPQQQPQDAER